MISPSRHQGHAPVASPADSPRNGGGVAYGRPFWLGYTGNLLLCVAISLLYRYADFVTLLDGSEFELGWIVGIGTIGSLVMRLALGMGIDHHGPRLAWLGSVVLFVLTCFAHLLLTSCHSPPIYLLRILFCCSLAGIFGASTTFAAGRAPIERVAEMVGMLGTAGFVGMVIGTQLGDLMLSTASPERWQIDQMFVVAALLGVVSFGFIALATRGQRPAARGGRHPAVLKLLRQYNPGMVLVVAAAMGVGLSLPATFLPTYTAELGISRIGLFFATYSTAAVVTRVLTRRWPERFGPAPIILLGVTGMALSQLLFLPVRQEWQLIFPGLGYGIFHAILFPSAIAAGARSFPEQHRGLAAVLVLGMYDVGVLVGAPLAGAVLRYSGAVGLPAYPTMFACAAAVLAVVGLCYAISIGRAAAILLYGREKSWMTPK